MCKIIYPQEINWQVSDCCLTTNVAIFFMARTSLFLMIWCQLCTRPTQWIFIHFVVLDHWNNTMHVAPLWHIMIILVARQPVFTLTPHYCVLSKRRAENTNLKFIVSWTGCINLPQSKRVVTRPGLHASIYHNRSEHANHYTTDAVLGFKDFTLRQ